MKVREYIEKIGENKKPEDMQELGDMLAEIIYSSKESHPDLYEKYKMKLYVMAYGKVLTDEMAKDIVYKMQPYGQRWSIEETTEVKNKHGLNDISNADFYVTMNKTYNDNKSTIDKFITDENQKVEMYVDLSKDFITDIDAKKGKVFTYFMTIPE